MILRRRQLSPNGLRLLNVFFALALSASPVAEAVKRAAAPTIWLTYPTARSDERQAEITRLPEAMCPTRRSATDSLTRLEAGSSVEVRWQDNTAGAAASAPKRAKIELLAAENNGILARLDILDKDNSDTNTKWTLLPENFECHECILRLTVDADDDSQLVSCADVEIVKPVAVRSPATSIALGAPPVDCKADAECGRGGECYRGSCFCSGGYFGRNCLNESQFATPSAISSLQSSKYHAFTFSSQSQLMWRLNEEASEPQLEMALRVQPSASIQDEVEWYVLALRADSQSASRQCASMRTQPPLPEVANRALGVATKTDTEDKSAAPRNAAKSAADGGKASAESVGNKQILNIKKIVETASSASAVVSSTTATPFTTTSTKTGPEAKKNTSVKVPSDSICSGDNEVFSDCPEFSRECEPSCDWTVFPESIPACPKACGMPRCVCREGYVRVGNDRDDCKPFDFCQAAEVEHVCARNESYAKCGAACEPSCESMYNVEPCQATCQAAACTCVDDYVRHNGQCIFWGNCPHLEERFLFTTGSIPTLIGADSAIAFNAQQPAMAVPPQVANNKQQKAKNAASTDAKESGAFLAIDAPTSLPPVNTELRCSINETMNECGTVCETDCVTIFDRGECSECGAEPACSCKQGHARHADGRCIYWADCAIEGTDLQTVARAMMSTAVSFLTGTTTTTTTSTATTTTPAATSPASTAVKSKSKSTTAQQSRKTFASATPAERTSTVAEKMLTASEASKTPTTITTTSSTTNQSAAVHSRKQSHPCIGEWRWPTGCEVDCDYRVSWTYTPESDLMEFALETRIPSNWWSGIGFMMPGGFRADMIVVRSRNGDALTLHDMHTDEKGSLVEDIDSEDVFPTDSSRLGSHSNGILRASFSRKRSLSAFSNEDASFDDDHCFRMVFPVSGGRLDENGTIGNALATPHFSAEAVCIRACAEQSSISEQQHPSESVTTTTTTMAAPMPLPYSCETEFRYPAGCEPESCDYRANWTLDASTGTVEFHVAAKGVGRWTGIGWSRSGEMSNADIVAGWVYDQKAFVTDRFAYARQLPAIDAGAARQNLEDVRGQLVDDVQTISFRRKIVTNDDSTDLPLNECYFFLYPVGGGRVLARQSADFRNARTPIGYHDQIRPEVSTQRVCLCVDGFPIGGVPTADAAKEPSTSESAEAASARVKRQATSAVATTAPTDNTSEALACADLTIIEIRRNPEDGRRSVRVTSPTSPASLLDVSAAFDEAPANPLNNVVGDTRVGDSLIVYIHKNLSNNSGQSAAISLSDVRNSPAVIHLAHGKGRLDANNADAPLEFTRIHLAKPERYVGEVSASNAPEIVSSTTSLPEPTGSEESSPFEIDITSSRFETIPVSIATTFAPETDAPEEAGGGESNNCHGRFEYPPGCAAVIPTSVDESSATECDYTVEWWTRAEKRTVDFTLTARLGVEKWTGVGFSPNGAMTNADVVVVSVLRDATATVTDQFSSGYTRPRVDAMQDVFNVYALWRDGHVTANFSRSLSTGDAADDVDLAAHCQRFIFIHAGGDLDPTSGELLGKHADTPIASAKPICLGTCRREVSPPLVMPSAPVEQPETNAELLPTTTTAIKVTTETISVSGESELTSTMAVDVSSTTTPTTTTSSEPPSMMTKPAPTRVEVPPKKTADADILLANVGGGAANAVDGETDDAEHVVIPPAGPATTNRLYDVVIRLINEKFTPELEDATSKEYAALAQRIQNALSPLIVTRWSSLKALRVQKFAAGSVLALLQLEFDGDSAPADEDELKAFLKQMIVQEASAASLSIDGDAMEVKENDDMNLEDKWAPLREFGVFAILAVVLVAFAVVFLLCFVCICRRSGPRSAHHKTYPKSPFLMSGSHYPYTSYPGVAATFGPSSKDTVLTKASSNASSSAGSGNTPNAKRGGTLRSGSGAAECPRGIGETTYQEWFAKVASKETPSHYQENAASAIYGTPVTRQPRGGLAAAAVSSVTPHQSYVTYPNEPSAYYTLSGEHRIHRHGAAVVGDYGGVGGAAAAPPSYYHHQQRHY